MIITNVWENKNVPNHQPANYDNEIPYNHRDHLVGAMCQPIWKTWGLVTWDGYSRWKNHEKATKIPVPGATSRSFSCWTQRWLGPLGPAPDGILGSSPKMEYGWVSMDFPMKINWTISYIIPIVFHYGTSTVHGKLDPISSPIFFEHWYNDLWFVCG